MVTTLHLKRFLLGVLWSGIGAGLCPQVSAQTSADSFYSGPLNTPGIPPNRSATVTDFDSINIYNGNVHFSYPLYTAQVNSGLTYTLKLTYNSNIWYGYSRSAYGPKITMGQWGPVGLGFKMHFGRLYTIEDYDSGFPFLFYEDQEGTVHQLFREIINGTTYYFTFDGLNIKVQQASTGWNVWSSDGTLYEMRYHVDEFQGIAGYWYKPGIHGWYTTRIVSPVLPDTNYVNIEYDPRQPACLWSVIDSQGRTITFRNIGIKDGIPILGGYTISVEVPAFNGTRATYSLEYATDVVSAPRANLRDDPARQLLLSRLGLPNGVNAYGFGYGRVYDENRNEFIDAGVVLSILHPSGARTIYSYDGLPQRFDVFFWGIVSRSLARRPFDPVQLMATWTYDRWPIGFANPSPHGVDVTDPYGNQTRYTFMEQPCCTLAGDRIGFGREWVREEYHGAIASAELVKRTEREWTLDVVASSDLQSTPYRNVRPRKMKTVYPGTVEKSSTIVYSEWDGYHWKSASELDAAGALYRTTRTDYAIPGYGTPRWDKWIIDIYTQKTLTAADGTAVRRSEFGYLPDGRLDSRVDRMSASGVSGGDIITRYAYDSATGNLSSISPTRWDGTGAPRTKLIGYQCGYKSREQFMGVLWRSVDYDIDCNTGLVSSSRDPKGIGTTYSYDVMGRVRSVSPGASPGTPEPLVMIGYPSFLEMTIERGPSGTADYLYEHRIYNSFGDLETVERLDESGSLIKQYTAREFDHLLTFQSEWSRGTGIPTQGTTYSYTYPLTSDPTRQYFDPLGRVHEVTTADGKTTEYSYDGRDRVVRVGGINNNPGEVAVTTFRSDEFGRLVGVIPPVGASRAEYDYDETDSLVTVRAYDLSGIAIVQQRHRTYDRLGRLTSKDDVESGVTTYEEYDVTGNLLRSRMPDGTTIRNYYDGANRLMRTTVQPIAAGSEVVVTERLYDEGPAAEFGLSAGSVTTENSFDDTGALLVSRRYQYTGPNGKVQYLKTNFSGWTNLGQPVTSGATVGYDTYGRIASIAYPLEDSSDRTATITTNRFAHGRLIGVDSNRGAIASAISYNAGGGTTDVAYGNGVQVSYPADVRNRVSQVVVRYGGTIHLDTGAFTYDGAGNIAYIGTDRYRYDLAGRLEEALVSANGFAPTAVSVDFQHDEFGNMTQVHKVVDPAGSAIATNRSLSVDPITNHLLAIDGRAVSHDAVGSLLSDGTYGFSWDKRGRLTAVVSGSQGVGEYAYDASDLRIQRYDKTQGQVTFYLRGIDGRVLSEYAKPWQSALNPVWNRDYIYAGRSLVGLVSNIEPLTPTGLTGIAGDRTVTLAWDSGTDADLAGFDVFRSRTSTASGGIFTRLNAAPVSTTSYVDSGLTNGSQYYYKIKAVDLAGNRSPFGSEFTATPQAPSGGGGGGGGGKKIMAARTTAGAAPTVSSPGPGVFFVHTDHLGSVRVITNGEGVAIATYHYLPFGEEIPQATQDVSPMRFAGHQRDKESSLDYMMARYCNASLARFLTADPSSLSVVPENPQSWNRYTYALNSPVNYVDPSGLFWVYGPGSDDFLLYVQGFIGMAAYVGANGEIQRAQGPARPGFEGNLALFDAAASAHFAIYAVREGEFAIDNFVSQSVNTTALAALPESPPKGYPQASTRGEILAHVFGEYTNAYYNGAFNDSYYPIAHTSGEFFQNKYRAAQGQNLIEGLAEPQSLTTGFLSGIFPSYNAAYINIKGGYATHVYARGSWLGGLIGPSVTVINVNPPE